jgi:exopolysaccharide production protein ExoY
MGGPVFYWQRRIGFRGRQFDCLKFRTMVSNADSALAAHLEANPAAAREWAQRRKLAHDPRITRLGRLLRQSSIDELPQLVNVLKGDMSCVGPRPVVESELARYGRCRQEYMAARPGLTGAWQVSGRNRLNYRTRIALDRRYVRRWSLWRDIAIIVRTIPAITRFDDTA